MDVEEFEVIISVNHKNNTFEIELKYDRLLISSEVIKLPECIFVVDVSSELIMLLDFVFTYFQLKLQLEAKATEGM